MKSLIYFLILGSISFGAFTASAKLPSNEKTAFSQTRKIKNSREIIFIHGMFMTPLCWDGWREKFADAGYKVSAPAWPLHQGSVEKLRQEEHLAALGALTLDQVLDYYRTILRAKAVKPILVGHSMGGLIAQILLSEGLGQAAIAIDSAPPKGVFTPSLSFLRSNWGTLDLFASPSSPIQMSFKAFSYAFVNAQSEDDQLRAYEKYYVPESRRIGRAPLTKAAKIDGDKARGPLLIVAGGADHIIPAALNYENFKFYRNTPGPTEFVLVPDRDHTTIVSPGWEDVAEIAQKWLRQQLAN